ncbi:uncharacterized protein BJ171DRAFT_570720 [Polychytrium aggregatum]|uniref:uncharacterized protein n=1 Tax=Polychytrium aggregatum TaxID=110093 RepID=UPI0022FE9C16|nr:uncharacterized protein BJ171DRAFT_570720 [Polychytrium aggregatum]KAI9197500.1 hypothetical protein BJ171DRAFT_570720 [Polychytrium aggregatum]
MSSSANIADVEAAPGEVPQFGSTTGLDRLGSLPRSARSGYIADLGEDDNPSSSGNESDEDQENSEEIIEGSSLEVMVFETLFAMVHKNDTIWPTIEIVFLVFEDMQFLSYVLQDNFGINYTSTFVLKLVKTIRITPDTWFLYIVYLSVALLLVWGMLANLLYTGRSLRDSTGAVWPLRTLRLFAGTMTTILYIPIVEILTFGLACDSTTAGTPLALLPSSSNPPSCLSGGQATIAAFSVLSLIMFVPLTHLFSLVYLDADPSSHHPTARAHGRVECFYLAVRTFVVVTGSILYVYVGFRIYSVFIAFLLAWISFLRIQPFYNSIFTDIRCGALFAGVLTSLLELLVYQSAIPAFGFDSPYFLTALLVLIPIGYVVGAATSFFYRRYLVHYYAVREQRSYEQEEEAYANMSSSDKQVSYQGSQDVFGLPSLHGLFERSESVYWRWTDVELVARESIADIRDQKSIMSPDDFLKLYRSFSCEFRDRPNRAEPHYHFALYAQTFYGDTPLVAKHISKAWHVKPASDIRFFIFYLKRIIQQKRQSADQTGNSSMQVVNMFEFNKYTRTATHHHQSAAANILATWRYVLENETDLRLLPNYAQKISLDIEYASEAYEILLAKFPQNQSALMSYSNFIRDIVGDKKRAKIMLERKSSSMLSIGGGRDMDEGSVSGSSSTREGSVAYSMSYRGSISSSGKSSTLTRINNTARRMKRRPAGTKASAKEVQEELISSFNDRQHMELTLMKRGLWVMSIGLVLLIAINIGLIMRTVGIYQTYMQWETTTAIAQYFINRVYRNTLRLSVSLSLQPPNMMEASEWADSLAYDSAQAITNVQELYMSSISFYSSGNPWLANTLVNGVQTPIYAALMNLAYEGSLLAYSIKSKGVGQNVSALINTDFLMVLSTGSSLGTLCDNVISQERANRLAGLQLPRLSTTVVLAVSIVLEYILITQTIIPALRRFHDQQESITKLFSKIPKATVKYLVTKMQTINNDIFMANGVDKLEIPMTETQGAEQAGSSNPREPEVEGERSLAEARVPPPRPETGESKYIRKSFGSTRFSNLKANESDMIEEDSESEDVQSNDRSLRSPQGTDMRAPLSIPRTRRPSCNIEISVQPSKSATDISEPKSPDKPIRSALRRANSVSRPGNSLGEANQGRLTVGSAAIHSYSATSLRISAEPVDLEETTESDHALAHDDKNASTNQLSKVDLSSKGSNKTIGFAITEPAPQTLKPEKSPLSNLVAQGATTLATMPLTTPQGALPGQGVSGDNENSDAGTSATVESTVSSTMINHMLLLMLFFVVKELLLLSIMNGAFDPMILSNVAKIWGICDLNGDLIRHQSIIVEFMIASIPWMASIVSDQESAISDMYSFEMLDTTLPDLMSYSTDLSDFLWTDQTPSSSSVPLIWYAGSWADSGVTCAYQNPVISTGTDPYYFNTTARPMPNSTALIYAFENIYFESETLLHSACKSISIILRNITNICSLSLNPLGTIPPITYNRTLHAGSGITASVVTSLDRMLLSLLLAHESFTMANSTLGSWMGPQWSLIDVLTEPTSLVGLIAWKEFNIQTFNSIITAFTIVFSVISALGVICIASALVAGTRAFHSLQRQTLQISAMFMMIPPHALDHISDLEQSVDTRISGPVSIILYWTWFLSWLKEALLVTALSPRELRDHDLEQGQTFEQVSTTIQPKTAAKINSVSRQEKSKRGLSHFGQSASIQEKSESPETDRPQKSWLSRFKGWR